MANSVVGNIKRMYVDSDNCYIQIRYNENTVSEGVPSPSNEYFILPLSHGNYNSFYSLLLATSINRLPVWIRAQSDIVAGAPAYIEYIVVDWSD